MSVAEKSHGNQLRTYLWLMLFSQVEYCEQKTYLWLMLFSQVEYGELKIYLWLMLFSQVEHCKRG